MKEQIELCSSLFSTVLHEVSKVRSFKGRWSVVKGKLVIFQTQLKDLNDFPNASNSLSSQLLQNLLQTLTEMTRLVVACQDATLPEGKLKTQSNIDSLSARLDCHVRDAEVLIKSGVLEDGVTAATSSKKESVRVGSRNLITRLQIGSVESKSLAMDSLLGLLNEDDKNVLIAVAQGVVPVLVKLLDSSSWEMKEKTVSAIARVSSVDSSKHVLIAEGLLLLNHLLRVVESGSGSAKERACVALQALSFSKENARTIGSRGGISSLLEICQAGTPNSQAVAAGVLRNLAKFGEIKENFMEENAVDVLLGLLGSGTSLAQENVIGCMSSLMAEDDNLKVLIVREGGIEGLKNFWDGVPAIQSLEVAIEFLRVLISCQPIGEMIVDEGFLGRIVRVLNCGALGVRMAAAKAVYDMGFNAKMRKELGDCGCIPPLIRMLENKAVEEKELAAKALLNLMNCAFNRKIFQKDERGTVSVVQLLDPLIQNLDKKYPVSILASIVQSKKCRKQMVAAGACLHLQKLAEMDVEGAKKLLGSLGRGKIWGVFARP